jgi:uncharacterized protein (UPF0262 family)
MTGKAGQTHAARLVALDIDQATIASVHEAVAAERDAAIRDLLSENVFTPVGRDGEVFRLRLSVVDRKLVLDISQPDGAPVLRHVLSPTPLRRVIRDYALVCDSYYAAVNDAAPARIEAIDMGRRGLHDEGAEILRERLKGKIDTDHATARRLFTLVAAFYRKG